MKVNFKIFLLNDAMIIKIDAFKIKFKNYLQLFAVVLFKRLNLRENLGDLYFFGGSTIFD